MPGAGVESLPIALTVKGHYFALQNFLKLLNDSAALRGDQVQATGRLYSVDNITFTGGAAGSAAPSSGGSTSPTPGAASLIQASLALNAYIYSPTSVAPVPVAPTDTSTTPRRPDVVRRLLLEQAGRQRIRIGSGRKGAAPEDHRRSPLPRPRRGPGLGVTDHPEGRSRLEDSRSSGCPRRHASCRAFDEAGAEGCAAFFAFRSVRGSASAAPVMPDSGMSRRPQALATRSPRRRRRPARLPPSAARRLCRSRSSSERPELDATRATAGS